MRYLASHDGGVYAMDEHMDVYDIYRPSAGLSPDFVHDGGVVDVIQDEDGVVWVKPLDQRSDGISKIGCVLPVNNGSRQFDDLMELVRQHAERLELHGKAMGYITEPVSMKPPETPKPGLR